MLTDTVNHSRLINKGKLVITELGYERKCARCGEFWPVDTEFYAKSTPSYCRACAAELKVVYRRNNQLNNIK